MNTDQTNKIIIISSPSGAGKTTLCKLLLKKIRNIKLSVSYTSRSKRLNEINGKDYFFVTKEKFNHLMNKNFFIETAINFGNYYGSPYKNLKTFKKNQILFDIDWKGARKIRKKVEIDTSYVCKQSYHNSPPVSSQLLSIPKTQNDFSKFGKPLLASNPSFVPPPGLYVFGNCPLSTAFANPINFARFSRPAFIAAVFSFFLICLAILVSVSLVVLLDRCDVHLLL